MIILILSMLDNLNPLLFDICQQVRQYFDLSLVLVVSFFCNNQIFNYIFYFEFFLNIAHQIG